MMYWNWTLNPLLTLLKQIVSASLNQTGLHKILLVEPYNWLFWGLAIVSAFCIPLCHFLSCNLGAR